MRVDTTSPTKPFYESPERPEKVEQTARRQRVAERIRQLAEPLFRARYLRVQHVEPDAARGCFWMHALSLNHRFSMRFCLPWEEMQELRSPRELAVYLMGQARAAVQLDFELQGRVRAGE